MNKKFKKRIMIMVCILSILVTSVSSLVAFGGMKAKAMDSEDVAKFQKYLNANFGAKLTVDGDYGPKTERAAVKALQRLYNEAYNTKLDVDGVLGKKTYNAINKHPIKRGTRNNIVKFFQKAYNCVSCQMGETYLIEDGIFGEKTEDKIVYLYQRYNKYDYSQVKNYINSTTWVYVLRL